MWIKCSERLPEVGQECVVQTDTNTAMVLTFGPHGFNTMRNEKNRIDCKAWFPVPELLKEGKDV